MKSTTSWVYRVVTYLIQMSKYTWQFFQLNTKETAWLNHTFQQQYPFARSKMQHTFHALCDKKGDKDYQLENPKYFQTLHIVERHASPFSCDICNGWYMSGYIGMKWQSKIPLSSQDNSANMRFLQPPWSLRPVGAQRWDILLPWGAGTEKQVLSMHEYR